ncbi:MAG: hypothetical protein HQ503_07190 [Rhodospirillales bacterium]|nr:hypothetical protein [Rhodospirillales bacterium]
MTILKTLATSYAPLKWAQRTRRCRAPHQLALAAAEDDGAMGWVVERFSDIRSD